MGKYLTAAAAAGLLLALGASAEAAGKGGGSGLPPGFSSPGGHGGFETFTETTPATTPGGTPTITTQTLPPGWDEGQAGWKSNLESSNPDLSSPSLFTPPGLHK